MLRVCVGLLLLGGGTHFARSRWGAMGLSFNINMDYLTPMPGGGDVVVDAKVGAAWV